MLAGTVVENAEQMARFREDWERTIGELVGENYHWHLAAELIHRTRAHHLREVLSWLIWRLGPMHS